MFHFSRRPLDDLAPDPRNARRHDLDALEASIVRFGFRSVVVVDPDGRIQAGHGRAAALRRLRAAGAPAPLGCEGWQVPCLVAPSEARESALAFLVADNRTQEHTRWDTDALAEILVDLASADGLEGTGYTLAEVERLAARVDADRAELAEALEAADGAGGADTEPEPMARSIVITFTDAARYARVLELLAAAPGATYADKVETALARG